MKFYTIKMVPDYSPIHLGLLRWSRLEPCLGPGYFLLWFLGCQRPACCWLRWGCINTGDPNVGVVLFKIDFSRIRTRMVGVLPEFFQELMTIFHLLFSSYKIELTFWYIVVLELGLWIVNLPTSAPIMVQRWEGSNKLSRFKTVQKLFSSDLSTNRHDLRKTWRGWMWSCWPETKFLNAAAWRRWRRRRLEEWSNGKTFKVQRFRINLNHCLRG